MVLRFYQDSDYEELKDLLERTGQFSPLFDRKDLLKKQMGHDPDSILLYEEEGRIIGTVFVLYNPWSSFIFHLGVHPDYQKRGIGSMLLDEAEKILKRKGAEQPALFVKREKGELLEFYKKKGWFIDCETYSMEKKL